MFGMSMTEIVIILVIALLVLGPKELPKAAKAIGKTLREVRRAGDDLRDTFEREVMHDEKTPRRPVKAPEGAVASGSDDTATKEPDSTQKSETPALTEANAAPKQQESEAEAEPATPASTRTGAA